MNGIIRPATYARVSSTQQAEEMTIESQISDLRIRVQKDQLVLDQSFEYVDEGFSGSNLLRPALERLRDHIAASLIDRLYVHSPDRLARNFAHQAILLEEILKSGCEVIFLNQEGLPDSPETKMLIQMQGMFAEYERAKIIERTRRGRRYAAAQGNVGVFGMAPYGYRYIRKDGNTPARWEIDPTEADVVRLIFSLVGKQGKSLRVVCRELNIRGILTKRGNAHWDQATVRGILNNSSYFGQARYGKTRLTPRKPGRRAKRGDPPIPRQAKVSVPTPLEEQTMIRVPALVSETLFKEVATQMEENRKRHRAVNSAPKYLLSGLVICGTCGSAYCGRRQSTRIYYRCIGTDKYRRAESAICDSTSIKGEPLEFNVWKDVCCLLRDPDRLREEFARRKQASSIPDSKIVKQQGQVDDLRKRLDRMIDAYADGIIEQTEFETRISRLRRQHDREVAALASLRGMASGAMDPTTASRNLASLGMQVGKNLESATFTLKRELLSLLIKQIEIHANEIRIVYKVPPNPFVPSPASRGKLQHWLSLQRMDLRPEKRETFTLVAFTRYASFHVLTGRKTHA